MPCRTDYQDEDRNPRIEYQDNPKLLDTINELEAAICAICNELEDRNILDEILANGSVNGRIKLHDIWNNHKQNDERRLKNELKKYTKHELKLLKRILNK